MNQERIYLSTIGTDAAEMAAAYGLGLEIAEYCTAWNMDEYLEETEETVRQKLGGIKRTVFHAPFNELFPCAIDPLARKLAADRYRQAIRLAGRYQASKIVIHGGFQPWMYYPVWYTEQSILFWKEFLRGFPKEDPGLEIVLENVLEPEPAMLLDIIKGVDHPKLSMCLDIGHVNAYSKIPVQEWLEMCAPYLGHFHIHNNDGSADTHNALDKGTIPIGALWKQIEELCPKATLTLELPQCAESVQWLLEKKCIS